MCNASRRKRDSAGRGFGVGASAATINQELGVIAQLFDYGTERGGIEARVAPLVLEYSPARWTASVKAHTRSGRARPKYRVRTGAKGADRALIRRREQPRAATDDEVVALLTHASSARDRLAIGLMRVPGLRVGAVATLRRDRIHTVQGKCQWDRLGAHVHVQDSGDHPGMDGVKYPAVLPLGGQVLQLYWAWLEERRSIAGASRSPWLFVTLPGSPRISSGQPISASGIRQVIGNLCHKAGTRHLTPHQLRHAMGEQAADMGLAPDILQVLLGHSSIESQQTYRHPSSEAMASAVERLDSRVPL